MGEVYVLVEEDEFRGVYSSLEKALEERAKLKTRAFIKHCIVDEFVKHALNLETTVIYPGEDPRTNKC